MTSLAWILISAWLRGSEDGVKRLAAIKKEEEEEDIMEGWVYEGEAKSNAAPAQQKEPVVKLEE